MQRIATDPNAGLKSQIKRFIDSPPENLNKQILQNLPTLLAESNLARACYKIAQAYQEDGQFDRASTWYHRGIDCKDDNDRRLCLRGLATIPVGSGYKPERDTAAEYLHQAWSLHTKDGEKTDIEAELKALTTQKPTSYTAHIALADIYFKRYLNEFNEVYSDKALNNHIFFLNSTFKNLSNNQKKQYQNLLENIINWRQFKQSEKTGSKESLAERKSTIYELTATAQTKLQLLTTTAKIYACDSYCYNYHQAPEKVFSYFAEVTNLGHLSQEQIGITATKYSNQTNELLASFPSYFGFEGSDIVAYRQAVYNFYDASRQHDHQHYTNGNEFKKLAEKTEKSKHELAKYFAADCYIRAGNAYEKTHAAKKTYFKEANNLYVNAYECLNKHGADPKTAVKALCQLTERMIELNDKDALQLHANTLLKLFASEAKAGNIDNLKHISKALIYLSSNKFLASDELYWLAFINNISGVVEETFADLEKEVSIWKAITSLIGKTEPSKTTLANDINKTALAVFEKTKEYALDNPFKNVHVLFYDKLADLHLRYQLKEPSDIIGLRKMAFDIATARTEKKSTPQQEKAQHEELANLKTKYINSLIWAAEIYLSKAHSKPTATSFAKAQAYFSEATQKYGDIRGLIGLAKLPRENRQETISYLEQALQQIHQKNQAELLNEAIHALTTLSEPLASEDPDRIKIEKDITQLFKREAREEKQFNRSEATAYEKALMEQAKEWLKLGDKCPLTEDNLNAILLDILSWPCKRDKELLTMIGNYSLQRKSGTKDEVARQCHLAFTDEPGISLKEKLAMLEKVAALDKRHDGPISTRLAELQVLIEAKDSYRGLVLILEKSRHYNVQTITQPYIDAIQEWIKRFATSQYMLSQPRNTEISFIAVINSIIDKNNPIAIYAKQEILNALKRTRGVIGLAFSLLFYMREANALTMGGKTSKESGNAQLNLINAILLRLHYQNISAQERETLDAILTKWNIYPLVKTLQEPALISTREAQCQAIILREKAFDTINMVRERKAEITDMIPFAQMDDLVSLNFLARQSETFDTEAAIYLYLKILILTADSQSAIDRFQLTPDLVENFKKNALQFVSAKSREKQLAIWGLQLIANPMIASNIMKLTPPPHTDTILTAALCNNWQLKNEVHFNSISQNGIYFPASHSSTRVEADRLADISNRLDLAKLSVKPKIATPVPAPTPLETKDKKDGKPVVISTLFVPAGASPAPREVVVQGQAVNKMKM